jgi:general stress protein 26
MSRKSLADIAKEMACIDIAILSTHTEGGEIANRPMSNNGDVSYDGTSYYFTYEQARAVTIFNEIRKWRSGSPPKAAFSQMASTWRSKELPN